MTKQGIVVSYATLDDGRREFDEIVATEAYVHLEKMSESQFCLVVETRGERAIFSIGAARAYVTASETSRDAINRRSEAQRRRWNALTPTQRKRKKR